ncbi:Cytochrome P450 monooxygenase hepH [Fulvia fulva]|uniref:Cytochrome P450 monooxygenase hepH n=1 Tax=Passalora fulva TaxID=5499 RepID=A0A9Q8LCJ0_PASFU|nr:Cytochrome P450 monooxygenase hepH [Fulvia fulva]KAK4629731.1 Cytochrome P450 monooxygenase hepH [Fulvia fulva]KAK4629771.1 Cytochrome P450 monooxygenase hepH [Fulvia fulva]UJO14975.1 Cytochrome P450 monooxygenase hepH [Fulvia fulva]WPV12388.1 Cytochrome P450 monooxygenase hepH [Fulvia fulva]WPV27972.1 Cytochrome P450 monooxygenase hepH [Fulvia fulva]
MVGLFEALTVNKHLPIVPRILSSLPRVVVEVLDPAFVPFFETQSLVAAQARKVWEEEKGKDKSKVEGEEKPKSIFHGIMQSSLPDEGKTHPRMVDEAFVLIVAGGETTARVTAVTLAHLLQNKSLISRLRKELDKLDIINDLPSSRRLEEIPLMKAIVQEGLRVAAPVTNAAKLIAPNEELECHGRSVPRGTPCSTNLQTVLHDPVIFPNPKYFDPDRWTRASERGERLERWLDTFSKGTRACLGMDGAYAELCIGIAAVVAR